MKEDLNYKPANLPKPNTDNEFDALLFQKTYDEIHAPIAIRDAVLTATLPEKKQNRSLRYAITVLIALLFLGGGVVYAQSTGLFRFTTYHGDKVDIFPSAYGYTMTVDSMPISAFELTGEIQNVVKEFQKIVRADEKEFYNVFHQFKSTADARAYIGYQWLKETHCPGIPHQIGVRVSGTHSDAIDEVSMSSNYLFQCGVGHNFIISEDAVIYTTNSINTYYGMGELYRNDEGISYETEELTTPAGNKAQIVYETYRDNGSMEAGSSMECCLVDHSVFYHLFISYPSCDFETAKDILQQWLEQF